ncbi:hypothetical protein [Streptomyces sp. NPDC047061]|uniref:hypothetical protein n=1 Tax=Streptomyces sp. NPDC047061 TaxID=3154605 RepID=UPI0033C14AA4
MTAERPPRLAVVLFRLYLRAVAPSPRARNHLLAGGHPEAALDEARRRDMDLLIDSHRIRHHI